MRLMIDLRARADAAYQTRYHDKLRGRLWRAFRGTEFDEEHGEGEPLGTVCSGVGTNP
jgi:CRISPR-associated endoribonuclease Cas6